MAILCACTTQEPVPYADQDNKIPDVNASAQISMQEAAEIAIKASAQFFPEKSRAGIIAVDNIIPILSTRCPSRSMADPLFYIVNYEDSAGFALVNALKTEPAIIGISDKGTYNASDLSKNPDGLNFLVDYITESAPSNKAITTNPLRPPYELNKITYDTIRYDIQEPKVKTEWHQVGFFGKFCPNGNAGCFPVAVAQALSVYKKPVTLWPTYPDAPVSSLIIPWDEIIPLKINSRIPSKLEDDKNIYPHEALGILLREIGHNSNVYYSETLTYWYPEEANLPKEFIRKSGLKISSLSPPFNYFPECKAQIKNGVIVMSGYTAENNTIHSGHAWVVDGYQDVKIKVTDWKRKESSSTWEIWQESYIDFFYVHINWGLGGEGDGYFHPEALKLKIDLGNETITNHYNQRFNYTLIYE